MTDNQIYWYVLFARTGAEEFVAERLKDRLGEGYLPFVPQKTCVFRRQGKKSEFQKICFPGYVFIESDKPADEFRGRAFPVVYQMKEAYRFLSYGDKSNLTMREEERLALSQILGMDKHIDISMGFKEGDAVKIISGSLIGKEGMIQEINKKQQIAIIGVSMFGTVVSVSVGLELVEKQ